MDVCDFYIGSNFIKTPLKKYFITWFILLFYSIIISLSMSGLFLVPCAVCTSTNLVIPSDPINTFFTFPSGHTPCGKSFSSIITSSTYFGWSKLKDTRATTVFKICQPNIDMPLFFQFFEPYQTISDRFICYEIIPAIFRVVILLFWWIQVTLNLWTQRFSALAFTWVFLYQSLFPGKYMKF